MKENDEWIKKVRDRMEDYSEPVPAGLWEQLETELVVPKVIPLWRRWQAVAAVGVLVILSSVTVWLWQSPSLDYIEQQSAELNRLQPTKAKQEMDRTSAATERSMAQLAPSVLPTEKKRDVRVAWKGEALQEVKPEQTDVAEYGEENRALEEVEKHEKQTSSKDKEQPSMSRSLGSSTPYNNKVYAGARDKKERRWSVGVSTTNGTFSSSVRMDGYLALPPSARAAWAGDAGYKIQARSDMEKVIQFANLAEGETGKSDVKYRMPVTVGVSFRFDLTEKWALETGLTYTQLASETRSGAKQNNYSWEDKLHYVGIPLKANRALWSNKRFEVYASAGGAVEKCVSGKQTLMWNTTAHVMKGSTEPAETDIKVKALQWSLAAAAGAQLKVTDRLGIYVEPGVVYYFDDGSEVNTIRKEHPLNFNLQLGLRWTVSK